MRVTAQLSETRSGEQLWSQTYERKLDDIFGIQDEIAKAVAAAMQVKLGLGDTSLMPGMTRDVAAYDEYLRGMALNLQMRPESFRPPSRTCNAPSRSTRGFLWRCQGCMGFTAMARTQFRNAPRNGGARQQRRCSRHVK